MSHGIGTVLVVDIYEFASSVHRVRVGSGLELNTSLNSTFHCIIESVGTGTGVFGPVIGSMSHEFSGRLGPDPIPITM